VRNVVAVASGTAALHLALESLQLPLGSEVVVPNFTMIAVPRAVTLAGHVPVFVDCGDDLNLDADLMQEACEDDGDNVRAVIAVHTYGRQCDMGKVAGYAEDYGLKVIEDLAEAHGVKPDSRTAAACYSFYSNKVIAGQEGGAVAFADPAHAELARSLRSLGFTPEHNFVHRPRGVNARMSNAHASIIGLSLLQVEHNLARRRQAEAWYDALCPGEWKMPPREVPWIYDVRVPGMTREVQDRVVAELRKSGIEARHAFKPCSSQEEYRGCKVVGGGKAEVASREVFYLPLTPGQVTEASARQAFDVITSVLGRHQSPR